MLLGVCGRRYVTPVMSIAQWPRSWEAPSGAGSAWDLVTCMPCSYCSTALHLGLLSASHTFTDLGQMFLRHRGIERQGQTDLNPQTIWVHAHGAKQKNHSLLLIWQSLSNITDLLPSLQVNAHSLSWQSILRRCRATFKLYLGLRS